MRQRKDGTWEARLAAGVAANGKRQRFSRYAKTKAEALKALDDLRTEHLAGTLRSPSKLTVAQYLENWLRDVVATTKADSTYETYSTSVSQHIVPAIGATKLAKLSPAQIQAFYAQLSRSDLAKGTTDKIHTVLHSALAHAVDMEILPRNPASKVKRPQGITQERGVLSPAQIDAFIAKLLDDRLMALYVMALFTTLREGELLALKWADANLADGSITVRRALKKKRGELNAKTGRYRHGYVLGPTKTPKSRRRIPLPRIALDALQEHRKRMMAEGHGSEFIFCTKSGTYIQPTNLRNRSFYPLLAKAGLPRVTFHDLRHSGATALLIEGVHPKVVQERLGHSSSRVTLDLYSHVIPDAQDAAVQAINARYGTLDKYRKR